MVKTKYCYVPLDLFYTKKSRGMGVELNKCSTARPGSTSPSHIFLDFTYAMIQKIAMEEDFYRFFIRNDEVQIPSIVENLGDKWPKICQNLPL